MFGPLTDYAGDFTENDFIVVHHSLRIHGTEHTSTPIFWALETTNFL